MKLLRILYILIMIPVLALMACSGSDGIADNPDHDHSGEMSQWQVKFNIGSVKSPTRAAGHLLDASTIQSDGIGIYCSWMQDGSKTSNPFPGTGTQATINYMNNTHGSYENGAWDYSPRRYWPLEGTLSFFAYAPYDSNMKIADSYTSGYPVLTFTPDSDASTQKDFVIAEPVSDQGPYPTSNPDPITFDFHHALTQIRFYAAYYFDSTAVSGNGTKFNPTTNYVHVDYIRIKNVIGSKTIQFSPTSPYFTWQADDGLTASSSYIAGLHDPTQLETGYLKRTNSATVKSNFLTDSAHVTAVTKTSGYFLLLPQAISPTTSSVDIGYSYHAVSSTGNINETLSSFEISVPLPSMTWEPGKIISYCFVIDCTKTSVLSFQAQNEDNGYIKTWGDGTPTDYSGDGSHDNPIEVE